MGSQEVSTTPGVVTNNDSTVEVETRAETTCEDLACYETHPPSKWRGPKLRVIMNPLSGGKKGPKVFMNQVLPGLNALVETAVIERFQTERQHHATELATIAANDPDVGCVMVIGGDGTVSEAINGLEADELRKDAKCGPLPALVVLSMGTRNYFSKSLKLPAPRDAPLAIAEGHVRSIPLMDVEYRGVTTFSDRVGRRSSRSSVHVTNADLHVARRWSFESVHIGLLAKIAKAGERYRRSKVLSPKIGQNAYALLSFAKAGSADRCFRARLRLTELFSTFDTYRNEIDERRNSNPMSKQVEFEKDFGWIMVSHFHPETGCYDDLLYVSYFTREQAPRFRKLVRFFKKGGISSGVSDLLTWHCVRSVEVDMFGEIMDFTIDGELRKGNHVSVSSWPDRLRVVTGKNK